MATSSETAKIDFVKNAETAVVNVLREEDNDVTLTASDVRRKFPRGAKVLSQSCDVTNHLETWKVVTWKVPKARPL